MLRNLDPLVFKDSNQYLSLAENILQGHWENFTFRTPGYPFFLATVKLATGSMSPWNITAIQVIFTSAIPLLLYAISYSILRQRYVASALACLFFLSWPAMAMSVAVLTESLTQFTLVVSVALAVRLCEKPSVGLALLYAIFSTGLIMIRPAFLPLAPATAMLCTFAWWRTGQIRKHWKPGAVMFVLPLTLVMCWCLEMKRQTGKFTISHITGVALLNQVSDQIETVETSSDPAMIDMLRMAVDELNHGQHLNVGWDVVEYQENQGIPPWETTERLKSLSIDLILKNPTQYLHKLADNSKEYWLGLATYIYADSQTQGAAFNSDFPGLIFRTIDEQVRKRPGRVTAIACISLVLSLYAMLFSRLGIIGRTQFAIVFSAIMICMLGHVLVNGADLARYRMPTIALINLLSSMALYIVLRDIAQASPPRRGLTLPGHADESSRPASHPHPLPAKPGSSADHPPLPTGHD